MKNIILTVPAALLLLFGACNNFFHELIPPNEDRIISFYIEDQLYSEIENNYVLITVKPGTSLKNTIPEITVSPGATVFPVTWEYSSRAFGDERTFGAAMQLYSGGNMTEKVIELVRDNKDFTRPVIDLPINFSYPVEFLVIAAAGSVRKYTVLIVEDSGEGVFSSFEFKKFYNTDLVSNVTADIYKGTKTVELTIKYPVENIASYSLIPEFKTNEARVFLGGLEITSGVSLLNFLKPPASSHLVDTQYNTQEKQLILKRAGYADAEWTLIVHFVEDPETIRSIIDFRFTKTRNPLIAADYMAEIIDSLDTGTINITVFYSGLRPDTLRPDFISPGNITVNGIPQINGTSAHDFSSPIEYLVTSKNGIYTRTYTVTVDLLPASDPLPQISSFSFIKANNPLLLSSSFAMIDHPGELITIEAAYTGGTPPYDLTADFSGNGEITVNGTPQISGLTAQNYAGPVWFTISNPSNPTLRRNYRIEVRYVQNLSSVAEITAFGFYKADNPDLLEDVNAVINEATGEITATLLFGTPGGSRTLVPRWTAQGRVEAGGEEQTSGVSGRHFYGPQGYKAVAIDSGLQRNYSVTIKEVNSRVYVNQSAAGRNDGTNWQNAYTNLTSACEDAALLPDDLYKDIWIAAGTYKPNTASFFRLTPNTNYIGGFNGTESLASQKNPSANTVNLSGDLGIGAYPVNLFNTPIVSGGEQMIINGDLFFEDLSLSGPVTDQYGMYFNLSPQSNVSINRLKIEYVTTGMRFIGGNELLIDDLELQDIYWYAINTGSCTFDTISLSNIKGSNIGASNSIELYSPFTSAVIKNSVFNTCGGVSISSSNSSANILVDNVILNDAKGNALLLGANNGGSITVDQVIIDGYDTTLANRGSGIYVSIGTGTASISRSVINNRVRGASANGAGITIYGYGHVDVSDTKFINCITPSYARIAHRANGTGLTSFLRCEFTHDANLVDPGTPNDYPPSQFNSSGSYYFEDCSFNNLRTNISTGENYIFDQRSSRTNSDIFAMPVSITLVNCTFDFAGSGLLGLAALGSSTNSLYMDGNTIKNYNGQQPLFWFGISPGGSNTYQFRPNNTYNGTLLNSLSAITGLGTGIIRLNYSAMPVIVP